MKVPQRPPNVHDSFVKISENDPQIWGRILQWLDRGARDESYYHWDDLRYRTPPEGLTSLTWWYAIKLERWTQRRAISLHDKDGVPFRFALPDPLPELLREIDLHAGGRIEVPLPVTNPEARNQYIISSLTEEAITSSQIEGASTTRQVAKEMLRQGRPPRDEAERMILNNYRAMERIRGLRDEPLSPGLVFEIHRMVVDGTLDDPSAAGRLRGPGEDRIVGDDSGEVFHVPPDHSELAGRLDAMCRFANGPTDGERGFIHPAARSMILHFWLAYDHPFVDGNGRTARALFYWSMLRHGYWMFEFVSISTIIRKSLVSYGRAFLHTETDENDLTYFLVYHARVIQKAVAQLIEHASRRAERLKSLEQQLRGTAELNHRQRELIAHALRHPGQVYTIESHRSSHGVVYQTARTDLLDLVERGLLHRRTVGQAFTFVAVPDLERRLAEPPKPRRGKRRSR